MNIDLNSINYEERVIAFIDILGFKEMINKSDSNQDIFNKVITALSEMRAMKKRNADYSQEYNSEIALFSDNIVISYIQNNKDAQYNVIQDCMYLQVLLLTKGIMVRGGISQGKLYHKGNLIFGPALVKAYELECKYAIYPRIILDETIISTGTIYSTDFDGIRYIDTLTNLGCCMGLDRDLYDIYYEIEKTVKNGMTSANNMGVKAKIKWLENYCKESFVLTPTEVKVFDKVDDKYERVNNAHKSHKIFEKYTSK